MLISLSPFASLPGQFVPLVASVIGDVLTLDGVEIDFSQLANGETWQAEDIGSPWIVNPVTRVDGEVRLTLRLPHGPNPSKDVAFPVALHVTADGPISLPY